jgi:hypothetical protein
VMKTIGCRAPASQRRTYGRTWMLGHQGQRWPVAYMARTEPRWSCTHSRGSCTWDRDQEKEKEGNTGSHQRHITTTMASRLREEDEAGTSSNRSTRWWFGMMMRWDGTIHLQQQS